MHAPWLLALVALVGPIGTATPRAPAAEGLKLLFVGNSLTYTHNVPDIIMAVDEPIDATQCGGKGHCHSDEDNKKSVCMTHHLWTGLNVKMMEYLNSVSLAELVSQQQTGKTTVIKDQRIIRGSSMSRATTTASAPVTA